MEPNRVRMADGVRKHTRTTKKSSLANCASRCAVDFDFEHFEYFEYLNILNV